MPGDTQAQAISEILSWLEQQLRLVRDEQAQSHGLLEQLQRQIHELREDTSATERAVREVDPKILPLKGVPEKIRELDEGAENIRQAVAANQAEIENALRLVRAEAEYDRLERAEAIRRVDTATTQLARIAADVAQTQNQGSQVAATVQTLLERQREVEAHAEQFGLRLERSIEVSRDLEERIRATIQNEQEERFDVVFERLQVVGEMVKRNEDMISATLAERSLREEVLQEIGVWRDQHSRIDARLNAIEELADKLLGTVDKLHGEITLLEGRHAGLGERVASIRRDIAEVVDHIREEFAKYNQMTEKQRRKQIQMLEQELRELKFHAFRPPEEP